MNSTAISWLVVIVFLVTPFQWTTSETVAVDAVLTARAVLLVMLFVAIRTKRFGPIAAGQAFLAIGIADMVAAATVMQPDPATVVTEAVAYGTILPVFTLLIAPRRTRRRWSLAVTGMVFGGAVLRLLPGDQVLLVQVMAVLTVHAAAVLVLDAHANRAEDAGAMATVDPLTGLVNRRPAIERLTTGLVESKETGRSSCVVMVDIDHFKRINDSLGHEAGDDTLRKVARELAKDVRTGDTLCRWGGEEFLVLLPDMSADVAERAAERMRSAIERVGVTASFGVAEASDHQSVAEWVHGADQAMYVAKRGGRNQVVVDQQSVPSPNSSRR